MIQRPRLANPLATRQAPDYRALNHTTTLVVESKPLATPPEAQQYFEPGINTKLNRRRKPKVDFMLPSDMPKYPLGFVPTNQTPGANGEEPALVVVKEGVPADLMDMFAKISAQQGAESKAVEAAKVAGRMDVGTMIAEQLLTTLKEVNTEAKISSLMKKGFTEGEAIGAVQTIRMDDAIKEAKLPSKPESVETMLAAQFPRRGVEMEVQTDVTVEKGKELYARAGRATAAVAMDKQLTEAAERRQVKAAKAESKTMAERAVAESAATAAREAVVGPRGRTLRELFAAKKDAV